MARAEAPTSESLSGTTTGVAAAMTAKSANPASTAAVFALRGAWRGGGWSAWLLTSVAALGAALTLRLFSLCRERRVAPRLLLGEIVTHVQAGELPAARQACERHPGPLASVTLATFDLLRHAPRAGTDALQVAVAAEVRRQVDLMTGPVGWLRDLAVLAPLLGALSMVLALVEGLTSGGEGGDVAATVARALVPLALGLVGAAGCFVCHAWFRRRTARLVAALEAASAEIALVLLGRYER